MFTWKNKLLEWVGPLLYLRLKSHSNKPKIVFLNCKYFRQLYHYLKFAHVKYPLKTATEKGILFLGAFVIKQWQTHCYRI